jgi:transcriptional regulator with XRE-family HTH domain
MTQKQIRELLVLKEWTREHLADLLGITRNSIDRWFCEREIQRRYPSKDHITRMQKWLLEARRESREEKQPA